MFHPGSVLGESFMGMDGDTVEFDFQQKNNEDDQDYQSESKESFIRSDDSKAVTDDGLPLVHQGEITVVEKESYHSESIQAHPLSYLDKTNTEHQKEALFHTTQFELQSFHVKMMLPHTIESSSSILVEPIHFISHMHPIESPEQFTGFSLNYFYPKQVSIYFSNQTFSPLIIEAPLGSNLPQILPKNIEEAFIPFSDDKKQPLVEESSTENQAFHIDENIVEEENETDIDESPSVDIPLEESPIPIVEQWGTKHHDEIIGGENKDVLYGLKGNDKLYGHLNDDKLYGGEGNDTLEGGEGDDQLYGETGRDTILGGVGSDRLYGGTGNDKLYGGDNNDILIDTSGNNSLYGEAGDDVLQGGIGKDYLSGGEDNDSLHGQEGNDKLYGDEGKDTLYGGSGSDRVYGGDGDDTLYGESGHDRFYGNQGNDTLIDLSRNNRLYGNEGDDFLKTGEGQDYLYGGDGNDLHDGHEDNNKLYGEKGNDTLIAGDGNNHFDGGAGDDWLQVGDGQNKLYGKDGNDAFYVGSGDNKIYGGNDDDFLQGGIGKNEFWGQNGNDTFLFGDGQSKGDIFHGGGGWLDTIQLDIEDIHSVSSTEIDSKNWLIELNEHTLHLNTKNSFTLSNDNLIFDRSASGTLSFEDGSSIRFDNLEQIDWDFHLV